MLVLAAVAIAALTYRRAREPRKRKTPSVSGFAWALMFLGGGRMPPPPPQSQIEQGAGERKNREIARSGDVNEFKVSSLIHDHAL